GLASHQKAVAAMDACRFKAETVSVELPGKKGPTLIEKDEGPRKDSSLEALAALKPSFEKDGTVTPGNAPGLNDGASALVVTSLAFAKAHGVKPLARITAYASAGGERLLTTLVFALKDRKQTTGLATLCLGGGNAVALSVEML